MFEIARRLCQEVASAPDWEVAAFGLQDKWNTQDSQLWAPCPVSSFQVVGPKQYGFAPAMLAALIDSNADLAHVHGLWMYPTLAARRWSNHSRKPYLVTVHGMLDTWALANSRWKKRLVAALFEHRVLQSSRCLHANTEVELQAIRSFGLTAPACIIPNGVDLPPEAPGKSIALPDDGAKILLFLGRLHPKKGLSNLLQAWARVIHDKKRPIWRLQLAGWDQRNHRSELERLAGELGLGNTVEFIGPLHGEAKATAYWTADAVILPSFSEGLPMAVLEAWAHAKPTLITPQCNLSIGYEREAAIRIEPSPEGIETGLRLLLEMSDSDRSAIGNRGRILAAEQFSWRSVAQQLRAVYRWMCGGGCPPSCVVANRA